MLWFLSNIVHSTSVQRHGASILEISVCVPSDRKQTQMSNIWHIAGSVTNYCAILYIIYTVAINVGRLVGHYGCLFSLRKGRGSHFLACINWFGNPYRTATHPKTGRQMIWRHWKVLILLLVQEKDCCRIMKVQRKARASLHWLAYNYHSILFLWGEKCLI